MLFSTEPDTFSANDGKIQPVRLSTQQEDARKQMRTTANTDHHVSATLDLSRPSEGGSSHTTVDANRIKPHFLPSPQGFFSCLFPNEPSLLEHIELVGSQYVFFISHHSKDPRLDFQQFPVLWMATRWRLQENVVHASQRRPQKADKGSDPLPADQGFKCKMRRDVVWLVSLASFCRSRSWFSKRLPESTLTKWSDGSETTKINHQKNSNIWSPMFRERHRFHGDTGIRTRRHEEITNSTIYQVWILFPGLKLDI